MPKELHEITKFTTGTITVPDEKDIPEDAASYSLNIDSVTEGGKLKGVPADFYLVNDGTFAASGTAEPCDASKLVMINNGGQRDIIWYDPDDNKLNSITDLYEKNGAMSRADLATNTSSADEVTMQVHNKEVHIGMGRGSADTPQWVGYVDHKQFGTAVTAIQKEDAELKAPGSFPEIYSAVTIGDYAYGIQYGGTRIYRFSPTAFDSVSTTVFTSTQGLSLVHAGDDIWVYDDNANYGTIYKIDVSAWGTADEITQSNSISGYTTAGTAPSSGFEVSDLFDDGTSMWVALWSNTAGSSGLISADSHGNFLHNVTLVANNDPYIFTNRTPTIDDEPGEIGEFLAQAEFYLYKQCLVDLADGTGIGMLGFLNTSGNAVVQTDSNEDGGGITITKGLILWSVQRTYTARDPYRMGFGSLSGTTNCQIHEVINAGTYTDYGGGSASRMDGGFHGDATRLFVTKWSSATSSAVYAFHDRFQSGVNAGVDSSSAHDSVPSAAGSNTGIEADGLTIAVVADHDSSGAAGVVYLFEQDGGGGFITSTYNDSTVASETYRERSDLRIAINSAAQAAGNFSSSNTYFWKFSFMYDEYQESPLSFSFSHNPTNSKNIKLTIDLYQASSISKRASHLMIYRSSATGASATTPDTFYRLVQNVPLANRFTLVSNGWGSSVDFRQLIFVDIEPNIGASYEARNLMPQTLETSSVNYALSTQINSMHIVGKCYKAEIPDAMNYLFKSKVNNFDQFDWTTDFLRLPTVPTAMTSFNGRIYVFDENNTYRINPQGFYIEDTFEGAGCFGSDAVVVTEYGMCYCDKNNIYLHDGKAPKPIASPILTGDATYSWHNIDTNRTPMVMFDAKRKSFVIFFSSLEASGTYTHGSDSPTVLIDSAASFSTTAAVGMRVYNTTDGSDGVITAVDSDTQVTLADLLGGSNNFWDASEDDAYTINKFYAWSYNIVYNRWDLLHFNDGNEPQGILHGKNGEMYVSDDQGSGAGKLVHFLGSTSPTLDLWEWQSKYMTMGEDTVKKMLYDVNVIGGTAPTISYGVNGDTTPTTSLVSSKVAAADKKSKSLQVKITQVAGATHKVDSVGVLYRRLPKTSGNI